MTPVVKDEPVVPPDCVACATESPGISTITPSEPAVEAGPTLSSLPTLEMAPPAFQQPGPVVQIPDIPQDSHDKSPGTAMSQLFGDVFITNVVEHSQGIREEAEEYQRLPCIPLHHNPLLWWKENKTKFPNLAHYARCMLAIPGTSVPSERIFSIAGNVVTVQRANLSPDNVNILIFLKKNMNLENW